MFSVLLTVLSPKTFQFTLPQCLVFIQPHSALLIPGLWMHWVGETLTVSPGSAAWCPGAEGLLGTAKSFLGHRWLKTGSFPVLLPAGGTQALLSGLQA